MSVSAPGSVASTMSFHVAGFRFVVTTDSRDVAEAAASLFADWVDPRVTPAHRTTYEVLGTGQNGQPELLMNGRSVQRGNPPGTMLTWVIADVARASLMRVATHVAVHAGVVSKGGVGVALPAPPDHGKTTTTIGLVRTGFEFLSDESALIGLQDGLVYPFTRPLLLAPDSMALFPDLRASLPGWAERVRNLDFLIPPGALRPGCLGEPCELRYIIAPRFEEGSPTELRAVSRAEMLSLLLEQTFNLEVVGGRGVERLAGVLRGAACYRLTVGNLDAAVRLIEDLMGGGST